MTQGLLQRLREATHEQHAALEKDLDLLRSGFGLAGYRRVLEAFYGFYAPWEQCAERVLSQGAPGFYENRRKTPLLVRDLAYVGSRPAAAAICTELPQTDSFPHVLGSLYVIEGSTLGGQLLTRHFGQTLGITAQAGGCFFASYGSAVGERWREFGALLAKHSCSENDEVIVVAARSTFILLHQWLCKRLNKEQAAIAELAHQPNT